MRCAAARLLVVCCALGGGGRDLLRARPPTAACARRHVLRSLAALLDDKSTDARYTKEFHLSKIVLAHLVHQLTLPAASFIILPWLEGPSFVN